MTHRYLTNWMGMLVTLFGLLALATPIFHEEMTGSRVAVFLILTAIVEFAHGFRRSTKAGQRSAWVGGFITFAIGVLLLNAPYITSAALIILLAGWFGIDALRHFVSALSNKRERKYSATYVLMAGVGNASVCVGLLISRDHAVVWTVAIAGGLRILGSAWNIFTTPVFTMQDSGATVVSDLRLPDNEEIQGYAKQITQEEIERAHIDRGWIIGFILTLFAIHLGRMGFDRTALGIMSPAFAVFGDVFLGLLIALIIMTPTVILWHKVSNGLVRRLWFWLVGKPKENRGWLRKGVGILLQRRLRTAIRLRKARYSLVSATSRALQWGLPLAAIIAATVPVWGISWYFDTENWAAGIWNSWAAARTDDWREAMVKAVLEKDPGETFSIKPPDIAAGKDFSFIVIGDTGEGDASQHSLRAQYLKTVQKDDVKFVIVSSDVVYPAGAMSDYEANFWLPFMGTTKPIYAIPGNHDWYDALEAFVATFYEPDAARITMRARIEVDKRITLTNERKIDQLIAEAARLSREYRVPAQRQKAPYFQFQTDTFALFAVDTGVVKKIDPVQMAWLKKALESAGGKTKMAILGHPLYAGGEYMAESNTDFAEIHNLLQQHQVAIVMAGDTHDLEYYAETKKGAEGIVHHFVNGGGGAYLSYGTSLAWPKQPATKEWAYYPARQQVIAKIDATTSRWKWPAWWWTKNTGGWPFAAEFLSAAFDANVAPYYQSFMEIRIEPSQKRIKLIPYGVHGRLQWSDFDHSAALIPSGQQADSLVEWTVPMGK